MTSRSPTIGTPLPKLSVIPDSPSKDAPETPASVVPFPAPQTFEIVPPLHGILLRLLTPQNPQSGSSGVHEDHAGLSGPSGDSQSQTHPTAPNISNGHSTDPSAAHLIPDLSAQGSNGPPALNVKDLPTATSSVKVRIQKARAVVEALPDVDRSVEEQQAEITELEDRIARLHAVISDFGNRAREAPQEQMEITHD
ncbi:hypothetical protein N7539_001773 [Penicillium diatomitis]|uniref:Mediator of RNA polymerase II transcription subunit 9 n=1 Tax=Penicillium diatomitis TaxID=2819901 RepID=A0A9X0BZZ9_9EURO|nr:uncharacterized protein N7539_001773 [Penicillium diatomitis]KAJ5493027.1 hypothetical protein N7539_001773 [Penicillium diatomitis]